MRPSSAAAIGWVLMIGAIAGTVVLGTLPTPWVIESPGPVYDTLGEVELEGEETPLIEIDGAETYPTSGSLDMLTVTLRGSREYPVSYLDLAMTWFDPSRALAPIDLVYPDGQTQDESSEQDAQMMADSQEEAVAAALTELGIDYTSIVTVRSTIEGYPADGVLEAGDRILTVDGDPIDGVTELSSTLAARPVGSSFQVGIEREGEPMTVTLTTAASEQDPTRVIIGILAGADYEFPFDVDINLGDVGGPSAGTMLALGIYDKLTPGELTGGARIAGTGTITAEGEVGAIGGIRQKMHGAVSAGADWFLAPISNCDEVTGHVPDGLEVVAVATLNEALDAVETIADGAAPGSLAGCPAG